MSISGKQFVQTFRRWLLFVSQHFHEKHIPRRILVQQHVSPSKQWVNRFHFIGPGGGEIGGLDLILVMVRLLRYERYYVDSTRPFGIVTILYHVYQLINHSFPNIFSTSYLKSNNQLHISEPYPTINTAWSKEVEHGSEFQLLFLILLVHRQLWFNWYGDCTMHLHLFIIY